MDGKERGGKGGDPTGVIEGLRFNIRFGFEAV